MRSGWPGLILAVALLAGRAAGLAAHARTAIPRAPASGVHQPVVLPQQGWIASATTSAARPSRSSTATAWWGSRPCGAPRCAGRG